jgi:hypothetical protein
MFWTLLHFTILFASASIILIWRLLRLARLAKPCQETTVRIYADGSTEEEITGTHYHIDPVDLFFWACNTTLFAMILLWRFNVFLNGRNGTANRSPAAPAAPSPTANHFVEEMMDIVKALQRARREDAEVRRIAGMPQF